MFHGQPHYNHFTGIKNHFGASYVGEPTFKSNLNCYYGTEKVLEKMHYFEAMKIGPKIFVTDNVIQYSEKVHLFFYFVVKGPNPTYKRSIIWTSPNVRTNIYIYIYRKGPMDPLHIM